MRERPHRIGKYRIDAELGRGATGTVYLANDGFGGRNVALKVAHPELLEDPRLKGRYRNFLRNEANLVGKLGHPHIVSIFDADVDADEPYVVMEYIKGNALDRYVTPETLLSVAEVLDLGFKCCNALDYAQRLGLVHRDLKPANLLRPISGGVKLTDFGASMMLNSQNTQIQGFVGSPAYMSPEQMREEELTHRSDVFSLGVVLYQLLTGSLPFEGENDFATVYKINYEEAVPPTTRRAGLPAGVDGVIAKALAKRAEDRYDNWVDFAEAIATLSHQAAKSSPEVDENRMFRALRGMSFFADFPDPAIWEALRLGRWARVVRGERVMREGAPGDSFYVVVEGEASVERKDWEVARVGRGVTIGEMIYLRPEHPTRTANVTALSDMLVFKIKSDALRTASETLRSRFDRAFIKLLVERLDEAGRRMSEFDLTL